MRYYIVAGEASGDMHGANLMEQLAKEDGNSSFRVWGGDKMKAQGAVLVKHYKDHAYMGFLPVIMNLKAIQRNFKFIEKDIKEYCPDVLILIDYSGFNLRVAERIKKTGIKIYYYISPQVWAWRTHRVKKIKALVDKMIVVLPFEKEFYRSKGMNVSYFGHPILDAFEKDNSNLLSKMDFLFRNQLDNRPVVALLPGSRRQEISAMLPIMLEVTDSFPTHQFVIAGAPSFDRIFYSKYLNKKNVTLVFDQTHQLLSCADYALVTSGTATLETALYNVPQIVCYKTGALTYQLVKKLIKVKFISLVNLILDEEIVKELIQDDFNAENLRIELAKLMVETYKTKLLKAYALLKEKLGSGGTSEKVAKHIYESLK